MDYCTGPTSEPSVVSGRHLKNGAPAQMPEEVTASLSKQGIKRIVSCSSKARRPPSHSASRCWARLLVLHDCGAPIAYCNRDNMRTICAATFAAVGWLADEQVIGHTPTGNCPTCLQNVVSDMPTCKPVDVVMADTSYSNVKAVGAQSAMAQDDTLRPAPCTVQCWQGRAADLLAGAVLELRDSFDRF